MTLPDENPGSSWQPGYSGRAGFREWRIALALRSLFAHVNHAASRADQDTPIANQPADLAVAEGSHPAARNPAETEFTWNRESLLREAVFQLGKMTPEERAAVLLRDRQNLSLDAVARTLGWSQKATRAHLAAARIKLRAGTSRVLVY